MGYPLEKSLNSITAESSNIEDNILFNDNLKDKMKYHWVDFPHALSIRQIRFTFSCHENVGYEFK